MYTLGTDPMHVADLVFGDPIYLEWTGDLTLRASAETPVPAALPMFATGLAGLGWLARRRRKQAA
jgi:hypothetical protein